MFPGLKGERNYKVSYSDVIRLPTKLENIGSHIDMQTQAGSRIAARVTSNRDGFRNRVTLNFGSMHAERLL